MSREDNGEFYVPFGRDEKESFAARHGLPPLKNILLSAVAALGFYLLIFLILLATGLRFSTVELSDGETLRFFGWVHDGTPRLGTSVTTDGLKIKISGGRASFSDGSEYSGELRNGLPNGRGTLQRPDGSVYTGEFADGLFSGSGLLKASDGSVYDGQFSNGIFNGFGTLTKSDGTVYIGGFENGDFSGQGAITYACGDSFTGIFYRGMRAEGTYTWKNSETLTGAFVNNLPDPEKYLIYNNRYRVRIVDGKIVEQLSYTPPQTTEDDTPAAG